MITRTIENDWIVLNAEDNYYNIKDGDVFKWTDSFCSRMVKNQGPNITVASQNIPAYEKAPIGKQLNIKSYIGFPLTAPDGSLYGTLCAIDHEPKNFSLENESGLFKMVAKYLSSFISKELEANELRNSLKMLDDMAYKNEMTGLYNRKAWDMLVEQEEIKSKRLGELSGIIILDLDGLKIINDQEGHPVGDIYIKKATRGYLISAMFQPPNSKTDYSLASGF